MMTENSFRPTYRRLGSSVFLITDSSEPSNFKLGLENVESNTGTLLDQSGGEYSGSGTAFRSGDLLFGKLRPYLAKVWLAVRNGTAVGDFNVFRATTAVDPRFLKYSIVSSYFIQEACSMSTGTKMPRIEWVYSKDIELNIPTIGVQRHIADYLDAETAQIDASIDAQRRLIALLQERRVAAIVASIQVNSPNRLGSVSSEVPWLSYGRTGWPVTRLKNFGRVTFRAPEKSVVCAVTRG